ncbi:hypothetical protein [Rummeliibacillus stabekisii]|uniref:DUF4177 domain-containing protein n=1 Tax=Rummeliibacillus stabekisii TaxID=241244 RepID=A0A143HFC4_9BACL|nr:hypothetical protein [Rummeliibacillus stabekisii]AMX00433.1 hypothetical protein ATY39_14035 [Rummeliibacillus stabekisii]
MAWGRDAGRKILRGYTAMDVQKRIDDYESRGWKQISKIQTENKNGGAYAVLMELNKRKHA